MTTFTTTHTVETRIEDYMIVDSTDTLVAYLAHDEDSEHADPTQHDGNLGIMAAYHNRYNLGHYNAPEVERLKSWLDSAGQYDDYEEEDPEYPWYDLPEDKDESEPIGAKVERFCKAVFGSIVVLPLYLYDHSGLSISVGAFGCSWDSGQVGWIFDTEETRKQSGLVLGESYDLTVTEYLKDQVKEYDTYIRGEVYGVVVAKHDDGAITEVVDSCWGYLGDENAKAEAKAMLDHYAAQA